MAIITNYSTLQTAIGDYLARSDLSSFFPNFTQAAEAKLYKRLRIRAMETALSGTISSGVLAVPSDFLELKFAYVTTSPVQWLKKTTPEHIYNDWPVRSGSAIPTHISRQGTNFIFGPYPGAYTVAGIYYARLTALSGSNTTNWFITNAPDVLLYGSLLEAAPFLGDDPRVPIWAEAFAQCIALIEEEERREGARGSSRAARVG